MDTLAAPARRPAGPEAVVAGWLDDGAAASGSAPGAVPGSSGTSRASGPSPPGRATPAQAAPTNVVPASKPATATRRSERGFSMTGPRSGAGEGDGGAVALAELVDEVPGLDGRPLTGRQVRVCDPPVALADGQRGA